MSELNDFIAAQHQQNLVVMQSLGRIEQSVRDTNQRLLGGDGQQGIITYLSDVSEKLTARLSVLETWKTGTVRWVGGVVAVFTLEGTALAFYMNHVAKAAQAVQSMIKPH